MNTALVQGCALIFVTALWMNSQTADFEGDTNCKIPVDCKSEERKFTIVL